MKKLLEVKDLNVTFMTQRQLLHVVRGVDLDLIEGESLGIIGESGCGKSTVAKALINLLPIQTTKFSGEILYKNQNLVSFSESQMHSIRGKEIGIIFQDSATALNPILKIKAQIIEGYREHFPKASINEAKEAAHEILGNINMPRFRDVMEAYPYELSGGMRQRVAIAIALICKPKILIADEPTTALDVKAQFQILTYLKELQKEKKTSILLITHDINLASYFCNRLMVMYGGKIVEAGKKEEIFANPQHPYTRALLKAIPRIDKIQKQPLTSIEGSSPNLALPMAYCSFCSRCPDAMNICAKISPPLFQISSSHWCACFKNDSRYSP